MSTYGVLSNISIWMFSAVYSTDMIWCDSMMIYIYMMCKRTEHKVRGEVCYVRVHHQNQRKSPKQKLWWRKQENQEEKRKRVRLFWEAAPGEWGPRGVDFSTALLWHTQASLQNWLGSLREAWWEKIWHVDLKIPWNYDIHTHTLFLSISVFCRFDNIRHLSGTVVSTCTTLGHVSSPLVLLVLVLVCATVAGGALGVEVVGGAGAGAGAVLRFCSGNASVTKLRVKFMWLLHATFPSFPTTKIQP